MASSSFLKPNREKKKEIQYVQIEDTSSLKKDKFLGEYSTEEEKAIIRHNLNVPSADVVLSKKDIENKIKNAINKAVKEHLSLEDPHSFKKYIVKAIDGIVKNNGSTPFIVPLSGKDPTKAEHLATKRYIDTLIKTSIDAVQQSLIKELNKVELYIVKKLDDYSSTKEIQNYIKNATLNYTSKSDLNKVNDSLNKKLQGCVDDKYVKKQLEFALEDYVTDKQISSLKKEIKKDSSNFISKKDMKQFTTKSILDIDLLSKLNSLTSIKDTLDNLTTKKDTLNTPFTSPKQGVDAINDDELTTLGLVRNIVNSLKKNIWITDGPTLFDVGMLKLGTVLPKQLSMLLILDAIFYGRCITLTVPESCKVDESTTISIRITGDIKNLNYVQVLLGKKEIAIINRLYFSEEEVILDTELITEDTIITVKAYYNNGAILLDLQEIRCAFPVFIGLIQDFHPIENIISELLLKSNSINNKVIDATSAVEAIPFKYCFLNNGLIYRIMLAVPNSFPLLRYLKYDTTRLYKKYFSIHLLPFDINDRSIVYKIYLLEQPLSNLEKEVEFVFNKK